MVDINKTTISLFTTKRKITAVEIAIDFSLNKKT